MTTETDPRLEAVRKWLLTRHYTPEASKELAPQCLAAIDAVDPLRATLPLEPRWTAQKEALLKRLGEVVRGHARRTETWHELGMLIGNVFPKTNQEWPPTDCLYPNHCGRPDVDYCTHRESVCPHANRDGGGT